MKAIQERYAAAVSKVFNLFSFVFPFFPFFFFCVFVVLCRARAMFH